VLLEPDFNYMNKFIGKHLLNRAEWYGHISKEQFCSRKIHAAFNQAIYKVHEFDIMRQQKIKGALC